MAKVHQLYDSPFSISFHPTTSSNNGVGRALWLTGDCSLVTLKAVWKVICKICLWESVRYLAPGSVADFFCGTCAPIPIQSAMLDSWECGNMWKQFGRCLQFRQKGDFTECDTCTELKLSIMMHNVKREGYCSLVGFCSIMDAPSTWGHQFRPIRRMWLRAMTSKNRGQDKIWLLDDSLFQVRNWKTNADTKNNNQPCGIGLTGLIISKKKETLNIKLYTSLDKHPSSDLGKVKCAKCQKTRKHSCELPWQRGQGKGKQVIKGKGWNKQREEQFGKGNLPKALERIWKNELHKAFFYTVFFKKQITVFSSSNRLMTFRNQKSPCPMSYQGIWCTSWVCGGVWRPVPVRFSIGLPKHRLSIGMMTSRPLSCNSYWNSF